MGYIYLESYNSTLDSDQIIHLSAKALFCAVIERDAKKGVDIMLNTIANGPDASLRFLGELSNTIDQFREYLSNCGNYGISSPADVECLLNRFCDSMKKGAHEIKVGGWNDED